MHNSGVDEILAELADGAGSVHHLRRPGIGCQGIEPLLQGPERSEAVWPHQGQLQEHAEKIDLT